MKTVTINLYSFDELNEKSKQKVLSDFYDINTDYTWWEYDYDDAKEIGLNITGFNLDDMSIEAVLSRSDMMIVNILKNHGEECETYKIAAQYKKDSDYSRFEYKIKEEYLQILKREYEYRTTDAAIIETINCNEYSFLENGEMFNN